MSAFKCLRRAIGPVIANVCTFHYSVPSGLDILPPSVHFSAHTSRKLGRGISILDSGAGAGAEWLDQFQMGCYPASSARQGTKIVTDYSSNGMCALELALAVARFNSLLPNFKKGLILVRLFSIE